jgi:hypothetical protein
MCGKIERPPLVPVSGVHKRCALLRLNQIELCQAVRRQPLGLHRPSSHTRDAETQAPSAGEPMSAFAQQPRQHLRGGGRRVSELTRAEQPGSGFVRDGAAPLLARGGSGSFSG